MDGQNGLQALDVHAATFTDERLALVFQVANARGLSSLRVSIGSSIARFSKHLNALIERSAKPQRGLFPVPTAEAFASNLHPLQATARL
jgi:hypothetical protein